MQGITIFKALKPTLGVVSQSPFDNDDDNGNYNQQSNNKNKNRKRKTKKEKQSLQPPNGKFMFSLISLATR